jgi:hypothetical protein
MNFLGDTKDEGRISQKGVINHYFFEAFAMPLINLSWKARPCGPCLSAFPLVKRVTFQ